MDRIQEESITEMADSGNRSPAGPPTDTGPERVVTRSSWVKDHQVLLACLATLAVQFVIYMFGYREVIEYRMNDFKDVITRLETSVDDLDRKMNDLILELVRNGLDIDIEASVADEDEPESAN